MGPNDMCLHCAAHKYVEGVCIAQLNSSNSHMAAQLTNIARVCAATVPKLMSCFQTTTKPSFPSLMSCWFTIHGLKGHTNSPSCANACPHSRCQIGDSGVSWSTASLTVPDLHQSCTRQSKSSLTARARWTACQSCGTRTETHTWRNLESNHPHDHHPQCPWNCYGRCLCIVDPERQQHPGSSFVFCAKLQAIKQKQTHKAAF